MPSDRSQPLPGGRSRRFRPPRWRVYTWAIVIFNVLMLILVISQVISRADTCNGQTGSGLTNCQVGNIGLGVGVILLIILWALGDVILGVLWLVARPRTRPCPMCGNRVRRSVTQCRTCGYDFAQQLRVSPAAAGWGQGAAPEQPPPPPPPEGSKWGSGRG